MYLGAEPRSLLAHPLATTANLALFFDRLPISWAERYQLSLTCRNFMQAVEISKKWRTVTSIAMRDADQRITVNEHEQIFGPGECWANERDRTKAVWFLRHAKNVQCLSVSLGDARYINIQLYMLEALHNTKQHNAFLDMQHFLLTCHVTSGECLPHLGDLIQRFSGCKLKARLYSNVAHHRATCSLLYKIGVHSKLDKLYLALDGMHPRVLSTMLTYFKFKPVRQFHLDLLLPQMTLAQFGRQVLRTIKRVDFGQSLAQLINNFAPDHLQQLKIGLYNFAYRQVHFLEHVQPAALSRLDTLQVFVRPPAKITDTQLQLRVMSRLANLTPRIRHCNVNLCYGGLIDEQFAELPRIEPVLVSPTSDHSVASTSSMSATSPKSTAHCMTNGTVVGAAASVAASTSSCCAPVRPETLNGDQLLSVLSAWNERLNLGIQNLTLGELTIDAEHRCNLALSRWPRAYLTTESDDVNHYILRLPASSGEVHLDVRLLVLRHSPATDDYR